MYNAPFTVPAILLALVLIVSGLAKLVNLSTASDAFISLRLPQFLVKLKAPTLLPFGELVLAAGLLLTSGVWQLLFAVAALVLFIAYLVVIVRALTFNEKVTCSCFGKLGLGSVDVFTAIRNLILVGLAGLTLADAVHSRSVIARMRDFSGGDWCWLAGVLAAVVLTWLISGHRGEEQTASPLQSDDDEYRRWPIPFMTLYTPTDSTVTLRDLARNEPVMLLNVSPTCGSCIDTIERARTWQHTVAGLRTCLVLPMPVSSDAYGLKNADDFDILYDPNYDFGKLFQSGTPTAVLLGADGLLAGGPVTGKQAISEFLDDVAQELAAQREEISHTAKTSLDAAENAAVSETVETPAPTVSETAPPVTSPVAPAVPAAQTSHEELDEEEYFRQPTPFSMLTRGDDENYSLLALGDAGPTVFLSVSPGCGSCQDIIAQGPEWEKQLRGVHLFYLVPNQASVGALIDRGIEAEKIFFDPNYHLQPMMGLSTPSMFAIGPDRKLLAGPVNGSGDVATTMEDIIAEVAEVRNEDTAEHEADGFVPTSDEISATPSKTDAETALLTPSGLDSGKMVPSHHLTNAEGNTVKFDDGRERLLVFVSPGCEACHDVAARVEAWREQLPHKLIEVIVPGAPTDFEPDMYAPGTAPDLFDPTFAFGEALGIQTPALVELDGEGRLLAVPASSQGECYAVIRRLRAETV